MPSTANYSPPLGPTRLLENGHRNFNYVQDKKQPPEDSEGGKSRAAVAWVANWELGRDRRGIGRLCREVC